MRLGMTQKGRCAKAAQARQRLDGNDRRRAARWFRAPATLVRGGDLRVDQGAHAKRAIEVFGFAKGFPKARSKKCALAVRTARFDR